MGNPPRYLYEGSRELCILLGLCYQEWTRYYTNEKIPDCGEAVKRIDTKSEPHPNPYGGCKK